MTDRVEITKSGPQAQLENVSDWLTEIGYANYIDLFAKHEITAEEIAYIKDNHLQDMGITKIGDRIAIIAATDYFMRAARNEKRHKTVMKFKDWQWLSCLAIWRRSYNITESAILIQDPQPLKCCSISIDNVDITSIQDIKLEENIITSSIYITTTDKSVRGGVFRMKLGKLEATRAYKTIKNLWEEDQTRMGITFGKGIK